MWLKVLLAVLGGTVLIGVLTLVGLKFFLRHLVKKLMGAIAAPPAVRIKVVPKADDAPWNKKKRVHELRGELEQLAGFRWSSDVAFEPMENVFAALLVHPKGYGALVYDHREAGVWCDIVAAAQDRGGLTVSSTPMGGQLQTPPFAEKHFHADASVTDLWALFEERIKSFPQETLCCLTDENFAGLCEEAYADETDWRNAQGGPTEEEVRAVAKRSNPKASDDDIAQTAEIQQAMARAGLIEGLRERFREMMTPEQKLRFRSEDLVIIHDKLTPEELLANVFVHIDDDEWEVTGLPDACRDLAPRQAWEALQALLPEVVRFEKVATLDFPLPTDAYKPPAGSLPLELFPHKKRPPQGDCCGPAVDA